jgi:hypothetical protein
MYQIQRSLVLVIALCAFLASSGSTHARHLYPLQRRTQARVACLAHSLQRRASSLLASASCLLSCPDALPGLLERLGLPAELVRQGQ